LSFHLGILTGAAGSSSEPAFDEFFMMDGAAKKLAVAVFSFSGQDASVAVESASGQSARDFVAGAENRLAAEVVDWIAARGGKSYGPLVLYGPPGTGKSHLARAVAASSDGCVYTTAVDFARELGDAINAQAVGEFQARYRSASLLVLEDVGQLCGKRAALAEFQHTLDALEAREAQVVVTSHATPAEISGLPAGLVNRLSGGLVVSLSAPGSAARRVLLERLAVSSGVQLSVDALRLLTDKLSGNVVQLQGATLELAAAASPMDPAAPAVIDVAAAKRFLASRQPAFRPHLKDVSSAVAKLYGLKTAALTSSSRRRQVVLARSVAIYLGRVLAGASLAALGRFFGGRDHTTALHSCRSIERRLSRDADLRGVIGTLERMLSPA
jgi:chromosomal replication initiator protein